MQYSLLTLRIIVGFGLMEHVRSITLQSFIHKVSLYSSKEQLSRIYHTMMEEKPPGFYILVLWLAASQGRQHDTLVDLKGYVRI